ncbi:MAG: 7-cyano-7-deazaguanine synthase QueC [Deltaproteobacteria bacterium]|nr:7-cyano-7-deazaguanine synthase QueC [Deltaproteobacteria bacterium]
MKKAVILLSGGLDSTTCLAIARAQGFQCFTLSFDYGQRHRQELEKSILISQKLKAHAHKVVKVDLSSFGQSALTDNIDVPKGRSHKEMGEGIPITYVPARNTVFLSLALAWAEALEAYDIFIGVNALDYSGYPDCRGEYIDAFEKMANLATKKGVEGKRFTIHTPLLHMTKAEIIKKGLSLKVDYSLTHSCYDPRQNGSPCEFCDSCLLRQKGFEEVGIKDPLSFK